MRLCKSSLVVMDGGTEISTSRSDPARFEGATTGMHAGVELSLCEDLHATEQEWRAFEDRADYTPFQSFDWLAAWQRHIGSLSGVKPAIVLGRNAGGELLFILPLCVEPGRVIRRLTWLGADLSDYNAPLLSANFSREIGPSQFAPLWQAAIWLIRSAPRLRFDLVELRKMPETLGGRRNPFLDLFVLPNPNRAHMAALGADWESFYAKRSSATRRRDRTKLRRLAGHGEIRFIEATGREETERALQALFEQKARSLARIGVADLFANPGYREFFLDLATNPKLRRFIHVSRLQVGSVIAAANLGLNFRGCYYYVLSSYQDGELARFGPGAAHLRELIRYAIKGGLRRFDFTIGDEPYKRDWCDQRLNLYDHLAATGFRALPAAAWYASLICTKRFIKHNPLLWRLFSNARSMIGGLKSALASPAAE